MTRFKKYLSILPLFLALLLGSQYVQAKAVEGVVNINTASPKELMLLPGIGKAKAEQIIQLRQAKPFASVEELKAIKGLGTARLEALRHHVVMQGATTAKAVKTPKDAVQPAANPTSPKI